MLFARRYRCCLYSAASCCWLLAALASAQIDFRAGSLLDAPAPPEVTFSSIIAQPAEQLPSVVGMPLPSDAALASPPAAWSVLPPANPDFLYHVSGKARGYYINDQRIEFTGMESTFAVEGVLEGGFAQRIDGWELSLETQLFLNQPFDRNQLVDTPERRSFSANFDIDPLQISQLYLGARYGDCYAALGRFVTPF